MPTSGDWYCRVIGFEFGPMSWDDLMRMAQRTNLGRKDLVRQGDRGAWVMAESVPNLFSERTEPDTELDFDLGPS